MKDDPAKTLGIQKFVEITVSYTVYEINVFLHFIQKFKIACKNGVVGVGEERYLTKSGMTLWAPCG